MNDLHDLLQEHDVYLTVCYHANCPDGFASAWAVWHWIEEHRGGQKGGLTVDFVASQYGDPLPEMPTLGASQHWMVLIVDFSWPPEQLADLAEVARVVVLDHHATAMEAHGLDPQIGVGMLTIEAKHGSYEVTFDPNRSGATITWDWLYGEDSHPDLLAYVEDRDLWRKALPYTNEINAFIGTLPHYFSDWDDAAKTSRRDLMELGTGAVAHREAVIRSLLPTVRWHQLARVVTDSRDNTMSLVHRAFPMVECPAILASDMADAIMAETGYPMAATCSTESQGTGQDSARVLKLSLRSQGDVSVREFAEMFGGGGHQHAAGIRVRVPGVSGRELGDLAQKDPDLLKVAPNLMPTVVLRAIPQAEVMTPRWKDDYGWVKRG